MSILLRVRKFSDFFLRKNTIHSFCHPQTVVDKQKSAEFMAKRKLWVNKNCEINIASKEFRLYCGIFKFSASFALASLNASRAIKGHFNNSLWCAKTSPMDTCTSFSLTGVSKDLSNENLLQEIHSI